MEIVRGDFKFAFHFINGKLMNQPEVQVGNMAALDVYGKIDLLLMPLAKEYKINGVVYVESKNKLINVDYDITPLSAIKPIEEAIARIYKGLRK